MKVSEQPGAERPGREASIVPELWERRELPLESTGTNQGVKKLDTLAFGECP